MFSVVSLIPFRARGRESYVTITHVVNLAIQGAPKLRPQPQPQPHMGPHCTGTPWPHTPDDMGPHCTGTPPKPQPTPRHVQLGPHCKGTHTGPPMDMSQLVHYEVLTVGKWAVRILLECCLVNDKSTTQTV